MKRSVGILLRHGNHVLLQRRGDWNWEANLLQSYRGLLQTTAHGGCHPRESWESALFREVREELGPDTEAWVRQRDAAGELVLVHESICAGLHVRTYGVKRPLGLRQVQRIRLEPQSGGLIPWALDQVAYLKSISPEDQQAALPPGTLFPDEIEAIRAFAKLLDIPENC